MTDESDSKISPRTISRLPVYWRYLKELDDFGIERISSRELAKRIGITPSQLRQDLNQFGHFGQHGYGYPIGDLLSSISKILGLDSPRKMIIVGMGNLGTAIASYENFGRRNINIAGLFDVDPERIGAEVAGVEIVHIDKLSNFLEQNKVDIGCICTPPEVAPNLVNIMEENGVQGIWNFAPVRLQTKLPVEHLHLGDSLLELLYRINRREKL